MTATLKGNGHANISGDALMAALVANATISQADLPASAIIVGDEISYTDEPKISLPRDMSLRRAREILLRVERDQHTEVAQTKVFQYRPNDGAVATARVMKRRYGITFGEKIQSFFGDRPPQTLSVPVSVTETVEVPWGAMSIPALPGVELHLGEKRDRELGKVYQIEATYEKRYTKEIKSLFAEINTELKTNSIYRGKAILGTDDPEFLDFSAFRSNEIVFAEDVEEVLDGTIWSVLRYTDALKREGVRIKRAALLEGMYGCGKTSAGMLTAELAVANGWTYCKARPGEDVNDVMKLARLYAPAVVFVEDIDNEASTADGGEVSRLLETFDGVTSKGAELVVMMTTNHLERIHKGMLRPGRLDAVIHVGDLDRGGVERLIRAVVAPDKLAHDLDFDAVYESMHVMIDGHDGPVRHGFFPAFVRETLERAKTVAIGRQSGGTKYVLDTESLRVAASSLRPQLKVMLEAEEGERKPVLDTVLQEAIQRAVDGIRVVDSDGDYAFELEKQGA